MNNADLPTVFTPEEVAKHIGWSPRKLREFARELGACHILGNRMIMTQQNVDTILEACRPVAVLPPPLSVKTYLTSSKPPKKRIITPRGPGGSF